MARGNAREYLLKDQARIKKYSYVLRPLLAMRYIEGRNELPPILSDEKTAAASIAPEIKH